MSGLSDKKLSSLQIIASIKLDLQRIKKLVNEAEQLSESVSFSFSDLKNATATKLTENVRLSCVSALTEVKQLEAYLEQHAVFLQKPKEKPYAG